jgi:hypothetical protein
LKKTLAALAATLLFPVAAHAADVQPPPQAVYQAPGVDAQTLTDRGLSCIVKMSGPRSDQNVAGHVIVDNNIFEFYDTKWAGGVRVGRTKMTFEAKDGRFRISHQFPESPYLVDGYWSTPVKAVYRRMNVRLEEINQAVADCVNGGGATDSENW